MAEDWIEEGEEVHLGSDAKVITATDKAVLVECKEAFGFAPEWIPKSVIGDSSDVWDDTLSASGPGNLYVKRWWAEQNGLA